MTKKYPIILYPVEENGASTYSVLIPDFPGCVSHGDSEQDALENARAALDLHVQALIESGQTIPEPSTVDQVKDESEPGAIYALVELPLSEVRERALARKSTRINITFPGELLNKIDEYCEKSGVARSRLFQQLAERFLRDAGRTAHSEHLENALREALEASIQKPSGHSAEFERHSLIWQQALRHEFTRSSSPAGMPMYREPTSESLLVFVFYLFDAFRAFEKFRMAEELKEPGGTPALDRAK